MKSHPSFDGSLAASTIGISAGAFIEDTAVSAGPGRYRPVAHTEESRMPQLAVNGPLDEGDLDNDVRLHPVGAETRQSCSGGERRLRDLEPVEACSQLEQQSCVEPGADLSGEDEVLSLVVADEQGAKPHARTLR